MSFRFTVLETSLNRAEFQWKCLRLLQRLSVLGIVSCLVLVLFGAAMVRGYLTDRQTALIIGVALAVVIGVAFLFIVISTGAGSPQRHWLATQVERQDGRFFDRLSA